MRVLVTGAAGLYGLHTLEELESQQYISRVYGLDDFSRGYPREEDFMARPWGQKVQIINQRFQEITVKELNSLDLNVVIHLAGYNSGRESMNTPEEYFFNNEYGTFQFMQTLLRTRNRPFFIYASTIEVYGESVYTPVDEKHPVNPANVYAVTKLSGEKHVMAVGTRCNYPVTALRFTNTFGENQNIYGYTPVVSAFIDRALRNEPLIIYGTGEQIRDFIYVKDAVRALSLCITRRKAVQGAVINIASGKLTSICDLAEKIKQLTESTSEIIRLPCEKGEQNGIPVDSRLASRILEWFPKYTLDEGLLRTICWFKSLSSI